MTSSASLATHCQAPAGLFSSSHSWREEELEEVVAPPHRGAGPGDLEAGGDGVRALAAAVGAAPAQALLLERRALGLGADEVGSPAPCVLPNVWPPAMSATVSSSFIAMRRERVADVAGRGHRVGVAVGALGVDVDEAHLDRAERVLELALAAVALVAEPGVLRAPEDLLGLPDVLATEAEAEGLEAHVLERDVAGEHEQVGPRDLLAVLLLDRPEQAPGLVEVAVVGPAVERREPLAAVTGATASVVDAVGAGRVPAEADHEAAVVAEVGGPPVLRGASAPRRRRA